VLRLSHNQLRQLGSSCLTGLARLTHLHLDHNRLEQLGPGWLRSCPLLTHLDLSHNLLTSLDGQLTFAGAGQLRSLSLAANQLTELPQLGLLTGLHQLSLAANSLGPVLSLCQLLGQLSRLEQLSLADTELADLGPPCRMAAEDSNDEKVVTFSLLTWLDISGNWLPQPLPILASLTGLERLSACQHNLTSLSAAAFAGLSPSLRQIELAGCPQLVSLAAGLFPSRFTQLETIVIRDCPLLELLPARLIEPSSPLIGRPGENPANDEGPDGGSGTIRRRKLIISATDNSIRWVEPGALPWPEVEHLDLSGNPLHCDCGLTAAALDENGMSNGVLKLDTSRSTIAAGAARLTGVCYSPEHLTGRNVSDLAGDEFAACSSSSTTAAASLVFIGPLEVSVLAVALVLIVLAVGMVSFLIYRRGRGKDGSNRATAAVADILSPPLSAYLSPYGGSDQSGWAEKERIYSVSEEWAYLAAPACGCNENIYGLQHQHCHTAANGKSTGVGNRKLASTTQRNGIQFRAIYGLPENDWVSFQYFENILEVTIVQN
jgi:Leucine-rich repeat (LRR) protein